MSKKVCEKCKMPVKENDIICPYCGHPIISESSPMKRREEIKSEEMTPARRRAKRIENFIYLCIALGLIAFVVGMYFILKIFFNADFSMLLRDIIRLFESLLDFIKSAFK